MKKVLFIVLSILALQTFPSCDDGNEFDGNAVPSLKSYYLALSESEYEIESEVGSSASAQVSSFGTPWAFQGYANWLSVSPASGNNESAVSFSAAAANTSGDDMRTSIFQLASTDPNYALNSKVSVTQLAARPFIELSAKTLNFKGSSSSQPVVVSTNIAYTVQNGGGEWLTVVCSEDKTQLTVSVSENLTGKPRNATIKLTGKVEAIIQVNQAVPVINEIETQQLHFPIGGATYELSFNAEAAWTAVTTAGYWLSVSPENGSAGQNTISITALPNSSINEQSGNIQVLIGSTIGYTIPCAQEGLYVSLSLEKQQFEADGGILTYKVSSNTSWTIIEKPDWITTITPDHGNGNGEITLTASENWSLQQRSGKLRIGQSSVIGLEAEINLVQRGRTFEDLIALLQFDDDASSQSFDIVTNGRWDAESTEEWATIDKVSGTGNATVMVTVTENKAESIRNALIKVTVDGQTKTVAIEQKAKYFVVTPQNASLPSTGGSHSIHVSTNDSWTASTSSSWITLSSLSGIDDADLTITAGDNPSVYSRKDTTIINPAYHKPIEIVTLQSARYLKVSESTVYFFKKGGASKSIGVDTDGTYEISVDDDASDWLSVERSGNSFTLVATANETLAQRQAVINVSLTGLNVGESYYEEIAVSQNYKDGISVIPFGSDQTWEINSGESTTVTVTGFGSDNIWDEISGVGGNIGNSGFGSDNNWDN